MVTLVIVLSALLLGALAGAVFLLLDRERTRRGEAVLQSKLEDAQRQMAAITDELKEVERAQQATGESLREAEVLIKDREIAIGKLHTRIEEAELQRAAHSKELEKRLLETQERFKALLDTSAAAALKQSSEQFLKLAAKSFDESREKTNAAVDARIKPIDETLKKTGEKLGEIEKARLEAYAGLKQEVIASAEASRLVRKETNNLVNALRKPQVRGQYGEMQLRRVVELAGMRSYCDFTEQGSSRDSDGKLLRPDMIVRLPNDRQIAVDAKTNTAAYMEAIEADSEEKAEECLQRFARHVSDQAVALGKKEYAANVDGAFDFVVMFVPGDQFIDAALQRRPELIDLALQSGVILSSPATLIGLLRAVHIGWREKSLSDNAAELFALGKELHERTAVTLGHASEVGKAIDTARDRYNKFVGSVESRLIPTLRKFEERGASSSKQLEDLSRIEGEAREMRALPEAQVESKRKTDDESERIVVRREAQLDQPSLLPGND